jgi:hypothetical protein
MKLHEVLGSQNQVFTQAAKVRADLLTTFEKKRHLFGEAIVTFKPDGEGAQAVTESQSMLQSTVAKELNWLAETLAKAYDSEATIDQANTLAKADIVLDGGTVLVKDVPATQLLQLDKRLGELLQLLSSVPTLDPAKGFQPDTSRGNGVYQARLVRKRRTKKEQVPLTLIAPTKEHHRRN